MSRYIYSLNKHNYQGLIDTQYWIYKSVVIISLLVLYAFACKDLLLLLFLNWLAIVLTKLLSQESESLLDLKRRKKRSREFAKLKYFLSYFAFNAWRTLILIVWISELSHLVVTVTHYYLSIGIDRCSLFVNDENGLLESLSISFYRSIVIYAPLLALLWMLWLPNDEIQKKFNEVLFLKKSLGSYFRITLMNLLILIPDLLQD